MKLFIFVFFSILESNVDIFAKVLQTYQQFQTQSKQQQKKNSTLSFLFLLMSLFSKTFDETLLASESTRVTWHTIKALLGSC